MTVLHFSRRKFLAASIALAAVPLLPYSTATVQAEAVTGLFDDIPLADDVMGSAEAKVTIVEYTSMTCPHCRTFHEEVLPTIKKNFVDTGKVKFILRPFPFDGDRRGEAAFMLAKCAPNDKYYAMVDALFSTQQSWGTSGNPVPELLQLSKMAGMSEAGFKACLGNQELLNKIVKGRNKAVEDFGVNSTPTIFVNGEKLGDSSIESLTKAIEAAL